MQAGLRVRPGDQDEAEQVYFRRGTIPAMREHHAKEAGLKVLKTRGCKEHESCAKRSNFFKKLQLLQRVTFAISTGEKRAFETLLSSKLGLKNFTHEMQRWKLFQSFNYSEKAADLQTLSVGAQQFKF